MSRKDELIEIAEDRLNDREWFDYHDWDDLIECDEALTEKELAWLRENVVVEVTVKRKNKARKATGEGEGHD